MSVAATVSAMADATETYSDLYLTPTGRLLMEPAPAAAAWPDAEAGGRLAKAVGESTARGLLHLATRELNAALPPAAAWWREFGRRYLTQLCHTPNLEQAREVPSLPPPAGAGRWTCVRAAAPPFRIPRWWPAA